MRWTKAARVLLCALAVASGLAGCAQSEQAEGSPTPAPTATPTPTPAPTDPEPDGAPNDEADYYFDFGQDDRIRLDYDVSWPSADMEGWTEVESARVSALLTLECEGDAITVLLEDAPENPDLASFVTTARELLTFNYEGIALADGVQEGEYLLVAGTMPDGGIVTSCYRQIDGLYLTVELRAGAQTAESAQALLTGTFLPNLQVTRNATED